MNKLIEKRLSLFGNSAMFLLPEGDSSLKRTIDFSLAYGIDTLIKINEQQGYGLFFTPNGNLGHINKSGDGAKALHSKKDCEEYVASLYVDIDLKDTNYGSLDKLMKVTLDTIFTDKIPVQYITKSGGGLHLYTFIKQAERYTVGQSIFQKITEVQENFAKIFEGGCMNSHSINKLMRLPFSKYWRTIPTKEITLYKVNRTDTNIELELVTTPEQIVLDEALCIGEEHVMNFINNTAEIKTTKNRGAEYIGDIGSAQINAIPIADIIDKLKEYPRIYKGKKYEFTLKGTRIVLKIDGQTYIPDGYKFNKEKNYIHNFSLYEHPSEERPRGPAFVFMYNYFNKDITALNNFLSKEYDVSLSKGGEDGENYICLPTETGYIYFTDKGVFYSKSVFNKKAKTYEDMQIKLFDMPIYIKGIIKTSYDLFGETEDENIYYILYSPKKELEILLEYCTDRKAFNKKYGKKGLIFLGSEFDLIDLYNAINKAAESNVIKTYDLRYLNGYYPDCFIKGDRVYDRYGQIMDVSDTDIILKTQSIPHTNDNKDVTIQDFGEKLLKVFSKRLTMLSLTTFIALLLGHKFRVPMLKNYKQQVLMPGLFLSGITRSGKALSGSTEISMSSGEFKPIRDIVEGDSIIGGNGLPTKVIGKYNPQQTETYRVQFTDGSFVDTCADHLWKVYSFKKHYKEYILSTKQILQDGLTYNGHNNYSIDINKTQYPEQQYTITPYTLGAWLGDGSSDSSKIWIKHGDESIIDNISEDTHLVDIEHGCSKYWIEGLNPKLRELNLLQNKHIPQQYLSGSIEQRMELLAGLLDTDGTVNTGGSTTVTISTSVPALAEGIQQLINSLGRTYNLYKRIPKYTYKGIKREGQMEYRISFYPNKKVFKLQRQNDKLNINRRANRRFIKSITPILKEEEYYCITVDNEDHTFMCTRSYIKTHNTTLLTVLKNGAEITLDARKYSITGTSPQPLKQAATDDFILHVEEFTGMIGDAKETILRDIMNKAKTGRGMADGNNVFYIFRSSLILDGEHMPRSESVANRCIVIPMFDSSKDKIGTEKSLADMIQISYLKDFISKAYEYKQDDVLAIFKSVETILKKNGIGDRNLLLYSFLLTTNRMFTIFNEEELIEQMLANMMLHDTIDKQNNVLGNLLSELIIKNRINPTLTENEDCRQITIPYTMDIRGQNKIMFIDVIQQYADNIKIVGSNINIKIFADHGAIVKEKANIDIYNIILPYKSYFKVERFLDFIEVDVKQQN